MTDFCHPAQNKAFGLILIEISDAGSKDIYRKKIPHQRFN